MTIQRKFPFGQTVKLVSQLDRRPKRIFVLGVYASAVHAKWISQDDRTIIHALGIASEPEIFWRGENAEKIIANVQIPHEAGRLIPANYKMNGPSGRTLDSMYLEPLGLDRSDVWLCDLVPYSCMNGQQASALARTYDQLVVKLGLPAYDWPAIPKILTDNKRREEILEEVNSASPNVLITLGDHPLMWFTKYFGSKSKLAAYGNSTDSYGRLHEISIDSHRIYLLPLVHPRQAGKLGSHSKKWADLHESWTNSLARSVLIP